MTARVLVVWCPDWPLTAAGVDPAVPAIVASSGLVVAATTAARAMGVRRGQKLRDAQRFCPDADVLTADPDGEARAFERVVSAVEEICPRVEVVRPGLAAVAARGPARYHGGEEAVATIIRDAVLGRGLPCAVGVADGTFAARLAARSAWAGDTEGVTVVPSSHVPAFLAPRPIGVLDRPELTSVLIRMGIRTLGDLAALPEADVLERFGTEGAIAHRLAKGENARPPATRPPDEDLSAEITFDDPPQQIEPVVFAAKAAADRMHDTLAQRGLACVRFEVEVVTLDGGSRSRLWRHDGLLSSRAVAERVRWQLDTWRTSRALTGPVARLRLVPDHVVADTGRQLALWGQHDGNRQVDRAATRLQVMLGHDGVTRPVVGGGRSPADRVSRIPWGDVAAAPGASSPTPSSAASSSAAPSSGVTSVVTSAPVSSPPWPGSVPPPAPAVVHPTPRPAVVLDRTGRPVSVSSRSVVSAPPSWLMVDGSERVSITEWTGPWPVLERWWTDEARRCARFQLVAADGQAFLVRIEEEQWFVEATYA